MTDPIEGCIARWHEFMERPGSDGLDDLLHTDVVFYSPIVFTPQEGRELTKLYLTAAGGVLGGGNGGAGKSAAPNDSDRGFEYTKQVMGGNSAVLEFETTMGGKYVNGVDIITCDQEGMIVEFRVMIRPLQAINLLHEKMAAMLEDLQS